jgi:rhodanese-related sulfurtransferase
MPIEFVRDNLLLIAVAAVSGGMLLWPLVRRGAGGPWVSTLQATQLINRENALVIDVREPAEYAQGHVLGAKNVPLNELGARARDFEKYKARPVILVCASGNRSGAALATLKNRGFTNVANLSGGYGAWQQAGLPVEK